jgi:hypothetical protein
MLVDASGSLTIHSLVPTDRGNYSCEIRNHVGRAIIRYTLNVYGTCFFIDHSRDSHQHASGRIRTNDDRFQRAVCQSSLLSLVVEPPAFVDQTKKHEIEVMVSQSVLMPCLTMGYPPPNITWFRRNHPIDCL